MLGGKRKISACLIVTMLLAYVPAGAIDLPIARSSSGNCGANVTYSFDEGTATMTISGSGPMSDYGMYGDDRAPWCQEAWDVSNANN